MSEANFDICTTFLKKCIGRNSTFAKDLTMNHTTLPTNLYSNGMLLLVKCIR